MLLRNLQTSSASALKMEAVISFEKLYISANVSGDIQEDVTVMKTSRVVPNRCYLEVFRLIIYNIRSLPFLIIT